MPGWESLIDGSAITALLPDAYARYREPVRGALGYFLDHLPAEHQAELLTDQASLPLTAGAAERLARLARGCPALHKLGQVVARDRRLDPGLRSHLQELESLSPTVPVPAIVESLRHELGPLDRLGVALEPPPLAEASVAVVVPFRVEPGRGQGRGSGVFKLLKPGIEGRLDQELRLLEDVGDYLDERCDRFAIPHLDYADAFQQVREKLGEEVRLDQEQAHLAEAREFYRNDRDVLVPEPWPEFSTPRVTAMERVNGVKVTDHGLSEPRERHEVAGRVATALIARPVFCRSPRALFHGDPHAGNLLHTADGRLAVLDWSLVGRLTAADREALVQVLLGALTLDTHHTVATLAGLDTSGKADNVALAVVVADRFARLRRGEFPGYRWLTGLLDDAVLAAGLRVGPDLMLFRKSLHTLQGVIADVDSASGHEHAGLQREFLRNLIAEWPRRWASRPHARSFATRLSNADLVQAALGLPFAAARLWIDLVFGAASPGESADP